MMSRLREGLASVPGLQAGWHKFRSIPGQLAGLPPIDYSELTGERLLELIEKPDPTIIEIGCNDGQNTQGFLSLFARPKLYCFEPDPRAAGRFRARIGDRPDVHLFTTAISDHVGTVTFFQSDGKRDNKWLREMMPEGWDLSGSIRRPYRHLKKHPLITFDNQIEVPTTTLDLFCAEQGIDQVDFLWMDVQGAELDVFSGARATLGRTRYLYTEYSDRELYEGQVGLRPMLKHLPGFRVLTRYPGDALLQNMGILSHAL